MDLTAEDFEPWVGRKVRVGTIPEPVEITLASIMRRNRPLGIDVRPPFSLLFEAPLEVYLIDGTYEFDCGKGGPHAILITQLQPLADRRQYEAVFN
jgi:hypothetical protein